MIEKMVITKMTSEKNSFSPLSQEKAVPLLRTESEKWLTKLSEEEIYEKQR